MTKKDKNKQIKEFGIGLGVILFIIGMLPLIRKEDICWWLIYVSLVVFLIRLFMPTLLSPVYKVFLKVAHIVGKFNSVILLGIAYYLVVTPTSIFMSIFKKHNFNKGFDKSRKSYWIIRDKSFDDTKRMEKQF